MTADDGPKVISAQLNSKKKSKAELKEEVKDLAFSCDFLSFTSQIFVTLPSLSFTALQH